MKIRDYLYCMFVFLITIQSTSVLSEPNVLYTGPASRPIIEIWNKYQQPEDYKILNPEPALPIMPMTTTLTPKLNISNKPLPDYLQKGASFGMKPFFLIGVDPQSKQWLNENKNTLRDINATGLVIQANTALEVSELREIAPEIDFSFARTNELVTNLNLTHYPVLVSPNGIT